MLLSKHVDPHNLVFSTIDPRLFARGRFFDAQFGQTLFNGLRHTAQFFHLFNQFPGAFGQFVCKVLHIVAASPGVDRPADVGFFLQVNLGVAGNFS